MTTHSRYAWRLVPLAMIQTACGGNAAGSAGSDSTRVLANPDSSASAIVETWGRAVCKSGKLTRFDQAGLADDKAGGWISEGVVDGASCRLPGYGSSAVKSRVLHIYRSETALKSHLAGVNCEYLNVVGPRWVTQTTQESVAAELQEAGGHLLCVQD